jgi:hypothetical protein
MVRGIDCLLEEKRSSSAVMLLVLGRGTKLIPFGRSPGRGPLPPVGYRFPGYYGRASLLCPQESTEGRQGDGGIGQAALAPADNPLPVSSSVSDVDPSATDFWHVGHSKSIRFPSWSRLRTLTRLAASPPMNPE